MENGIENVSDSMLNLERSRQRKSQRVIGWEGHLLMRGRSACTWGEVECAFRGKVRGKSGIGVGADESCGSRDLNVYSILPSSLLFLLSIWW